MKGRESGMPEEAMWRTYFDADRMVEKLECAKRKVENVAEFGSGYGTFTLPVASLTSGIVHTFDIEPGLVSLVLKKAQNAGLTNVRGEARDFVVQGTGLKAASVDHVMIYNLLHIEEPTGLLREAYRILKPGGQISIIHWKHDSNTPRGPSLAIRPRPEECRAWAETVGFEFFREPDLSECCENHYGLILVRPDENGSAA